MIWKELDESLIFTNLHAKTNTEVMEQLGETLIKEGYAKESYIQALITREQEFSTGLDVDGVGVAIPHTDVSHVIKPGIAIAVLEKPIDFIQMGSDDDHVQVEIIFMLAVVNPSEHLGQLQKILAVIQDTAVLNKLLNVKDTKEIIEVIKEKEQTL